MSLLLDGSAGITFPDASVQTTTGQPVSGTAVTASGTSVDFTSIPAWVKRITVMISGMSASASSTPLIQIGDSGGIEVTGYLGSGGLVNNASPTVVTARTVGFAMNSGSSAAAVYYGHATLTLIQASSNTWVFSSVLGRSDGNVLHFGGGSKSLSGTLDRLRIIGSDTGSPVDTFDAGIINIMYE